MSITCDQVNAAGIEYVTDRVQRDKCARWNLSVGQYFMLRSNFSASQHYFFSGIAFLQEELWSADTKLCLELHNGAVISSFALGDDDDVERYAKPVIEHAPLNDTIEVQMMVLKTLSQSDRHKECISQGIKLLRQLDFHISLTPPKEDIFKVMMSTEMMVSRLSRDQIVSQCLKYQDDPSMIFKISRSVNISSFATGAPFCECTLLLCTCCFSFSSEP